MVNRAATQWKMVRERNERKIKRAQDTIRASLNCTCYLSVCGYLPRRWARYSSFSTEEFTSNDTRSMAKVGTSAIITRRKALATEASVSERMNLMKSSCGWGASRSVGQYLGKGEHEGGRGEE